MTRSVRKDGAAIEWGRTCTGCLPTRRSPLRPEGKSPWRPDWEHQRRKASPRMRSALLRAADAWLLIAYLSAGKLVTGRQMGGIAVENELSVLGSAIWHDRKLKIAFGAALKRGKVVAHIGRECGVNARAGRKQDTLEKTAPLTCRAGKTKSCSGELASTAKRMPLKCHGHVNVEKITVAGSCWGLKTIHGEKFSREK